MSRTIILACVLLSFLPMHIEQGTPARAQDLRLDSSFAMNSLAYLATKNNRFLDQATKSPATAHLLAHARNFDYGVPKDSPEALVRSLIEKNADRARWCRLALSFFEQRMSRDRRWIDDTLAYLPGDFRFHGTLFLTYGYDIGVAFGPNASLNCAHRHFEAHPRELLYYAIHELHHVGFYAYQPPPKISEVKTCADVARLVEYSTELEGMAVLAAYDRRRRERVLDGDPDYVALQDAARLDRDEAQYFADLEYLRRRGAEPADAAAWAVIERMSGGKRLWYRVGARMAQRIEAARGHAFLVDLIREGPQSFLESYRKLARR